MHIEVYSDAAAANDSAANLLAAWLCTPGVLNFMPAAGNTPLALYALIGQRTLPLQHLQVFALDEYVGVPLEEPRNCANLLRRSVAEAWGIPGAQFATVSSVESEALASVMEHERKIEAMGGIDVIVLGLGQNGHLGFNEPGSARDSLGRVLDLQPVSVEANREWFGGKYAPTRGVTVGLKTILAAKRVLLLAYGPQKRSAVKAMVEGPVSAECPGSFLQEHPNAFVFLDEAAAQSLSKLP
jgi:glucosamine-6-phosphate deaminase